MAIDISKFKVNVQSILDQKKKIEESKASRGGDWGELNFLQIKDGGKALIRIIPQPTGQVAKEVWRYRGVGDENFVSPRRHAGVEDPYSALHTYVTDRCKYWREYAEKTYGKDSQVHTSVFELTKEIWKTAGNLRDRVEYYVFCLQYVADPANLGVYNTYEPVVKIFRMSETTYESLLGIMSSPFYSNPPITDFDQGRQIYISRSGTKLDTVYEITPDPNQTKFPDLNILEKIPNLDLVFKPADVKEMKNCLETNGYYKFAQTVDSTVQSLISGLVGGGAPAIASVPAPTPAAPAPTPAAPAPTPAAPAFVPPAAPAFVPPAAPVAPVAFVPPAAPVAPPPFAPVAPPSLPQTPPTPFPSVPQVPPSTPPAVVSAPVPPTMVPPAPFVPNPPSSPSPFIPPAPVLPPPPTSAQAPQVAAPFVPPPPVAPAAPAAFVPPVAPTPPAAPANPAVPESPSSADDFMNQIEGKLASMRKPQ